VNIGFVSTRLAGTDGVSLETGKLNDILTQAGHKTFYCAGELDPDGPPGSLIPELHFEYPEVRALHDAAFRGVSLPNLRQRIDTLARQQVRSLLRFVDDCAIDLLIPQNVLAIPMNVSLGLALAELIKATGIPTLAHHHDFAWERERFRDSPIEDLIRAAFPPDDPSICHAVISTLARRELQTRCGIDSVVLPNVMDFESPPPAREDRCAELRARLGFDASDIVVLQPTRVVPRKGIEYSIDLIAGLAERLAPRTIRLLISHCAGDEGPEYLAWLETRARQARVSLTLAADLLVDQRQDGGSADRFDLRDAYEMSDFVAYPSLIEGFGNAFLEAVFYRRPLMVNRYPVYVSDIRPCGFDVIEIDQRVDDHTIRHVADVLETPSRYERMVSRNFELGRQSFSYETARTRLDEAFRRFDESA